jgi:4-aminobutyrate aminotransferase-like enzyme
MMAAHLDTYENLRQVINACLQNGLIADWFLFAPHALRIAPPLIIEDDAIGESCDILIHALKKIYR